MAAMMRLDIHSLFGFAYRAASPSIPLVIHIYSPTPEKYHEKIDIVKVLLTDSTGTVHLGADMAGRIGRLGETSTIGPVGIFRVIDMCDFDSAPLAAGSYVAKIAVLVYRADEAKSTAVELSAQTEITLI
jgi:hypothetical protein